MKVIDSIGEFQAFKREFYDKEKTVGFVPTMGALHDGHLTLMKKCKEERHITIVSIYINPKQFNSPEDFEKYPRDFNSDIQKLESVGVDAVFLPSDKEMYPNGFASYVDTTIHESLLESTTRPGHFRGVATIVSKLFNIIQPTHAYFGQKDFIQCIVIRKLVEDLNFPTAIIIVPTEREIDGLAMSSRNARLTEDERKRAPIIFGALKAAADLFLSKKTSFPLCASILTDTAKQIIEEERTFTLEYISVSNFSDGKDVDTLEAGKDYAISIAVIVGVVRLIDNIILYK